MVKYKRLRTSKKYNWRRIGSLIIALALISPLSLFWTAIITLPILEGIIFTLDEYDEVQQ